MRSLLQTILKILAKLILAKYKPEIIGITGSVGKTLTQNAIASILSQKFKTIVGDENLDPTFRIPKTILSAKPWHQKLVLEYGVEHPSDMDHYLSLVKPKIVVVTTISPTHLKYFTDVEGVFAEKSKLVQALPRDGYAVLNADDQQVVKMANLTSARICWFGQKSQDGVKISHFSQSLKGSKFRLHNNGDQATVSWKVVGHHQLLAAYAAATVGLICSMTLKQIAKGLSQTKPPIHRLNSITTKDIKILDDTYNASPKAATEAIKTLVDLGKRLDKIAVLGEMKDLGTDSEKFHQELGQKISRSNINRLVTIGKIANFIGQAAEKHHFKGKIVSVPNTKEAIKTLKNIVTPKSVVLIKGSRHAHLERIVLGLLHKSTKINCYHCGTLK